MKKLFLSIITLCMTMNTMYGMEERREEPPEHMAFRIFIENAHANTQLVRPIAREGVRQHPNGTYADFLAEYNGRLPIPFMRAVWQEVRPLLAAGNLLRRTTPLIIEIVEEKETDFSVFGDRSGKIHSKRMFFRLGKENSNNHSCYTYNNAYQENYASESVNAEFRHNIDDMIRRSKGTAEHIPTVRNAPWYVRVFCRALGYFWGPQTSVPLFGIKIDLPELMTQVFHENMIDLLRNAHNCHQEGWLTVVMLVQGNAIHVIVAHRGTVAVIPSIIIPGGEAFLSGPNSAPDGIVQQIVQDAIEHAIDHQPENLYTIDEAFRYLTERC